MAELDHVEGGNNKSSTSKKSCLLWGCGLSFAVMLIVVVSFVGLFQYGRSEVAPEVEEFLELVDQQEYQQAYAMVGYDWKKTQSIEEFETFLNVVHDRFGSFEGGSVSGIKVSTNTQGTYALLSYTATYAEETSVITFNLEKVGDDWLIRGANFASDKLVEAYRCAECTNTNVVGAAYCAKCGRQIDPLADRR